MLSWPILLMLNRKTHEFSLTRESVCTVSLLHWVTSRSRNNISQLETRQISDSKVQFCDGNYNRLRFIWTRSVACTVKQNCQSSIDHAHITVTLGDSSTTLIFTRYISHPQSAILARHFHQLFERKNTSKRVNQLLIHFFSRKLRLKRKTNE